MNHVKASAYILTLLHLTGCNLFSSLDKPSNDAQYRAAAEACIDESNFTCAEEYLSKISTNDLDTKLSLSVYTGLMKSGVTPGKLMKTLYDNLVSDTSTDWSQVALSPQLELNSEYFSPTVIPVGNFNPPKPTARTTCQLAKEHSYGMLLTAIAKLIDHPSIERRQALFDSTVYNSSQIRSSNQSKYLGFISTLTFLSFLLAENQSAPHTLKMSDLVKSPSGCLSVLKGQMADLTSCSKPDGSKLTMGTAINYETAVGSDFSGNVTMGMISSGASHLAISIDGLRSSSFDVQKLNDSIYKIADQFGVDTSSYKDCTAGPDSDCAPIRASLLNASIGDCR